MVPDTKPIPIDHMSQADSPRPSPDEHPRADCGCRTYWEDYVDGELGAMKTITIWTANHQLGCLRIPIRRREAIEHSRSALGDVPTVD